VKEILVGAEDLISSLLASGENISILDSCGVGYLGSHLLIAGVVAKESLEISSDRPEEVLEFIDRRFSEDQAAIFTFSYDFGRKLQNLRLKGPIFGEPDLSVSFYSDLIIHDYRTGRTFATVTHRR
jgi:hypothetical protein